jgi:hypothetical protein
LVPTPEGKGHNEGQIVALLQEAVRGEKPIVTLCKNKGISDPSPIFWTRWKVLNCYLQLPVNIRPERARPCPRRALPRSGSSPSCVPWKREPVPWTLAASLASPRPLSTAGTLEAQVRMDGGCRDAAPPTTRRGEIRIIEDRAGKVRALERVMNCSWLEVVHSLSVHPPSLPY